MELLWHNVAVVAQPHPRPAPAVNANLRCADRGGAQSGSGLIYRLENKMYALPCHPPPLSPMRSGIGSTFCGRSQVPKVPAGGREAGSAALP